MTLKLNPNIQTKKSSVFQKEDPVRPYLNEKLKYVSKHIRYSYTHLLRFLNKKYFSVCLGNDIYSSGQIIIERY